MIKFRHVADNCALNKLRRTSRLVTKIYTEYLQSSGLTPTQFSLMTALSLLGSVTIKRLAELMTMDRTTLTRNLKPLERDGLIKTFPGQDRRVRQVALTEKGRNVLDEALPRWEKAQAHLASILGNNQWEALHSSLDVVTKAILESKL
jgi:DNA-binding MarR family transcriptional regulator